MQTDYLKTALKIVEVRSFSKTAELLLLSIPSISHQVRTLEKEIGFKIFYRQPERSNPTLTEKGAIFLMWAKQAVEMLDEGILEANQDCEKTA